MLRGYLLSHGLQLRDLAGWRLREAHALSPGGRFIAGYGDNPQGLQQMFLVDLGPLPAPMITSASSATAVYDSPFTYTITATNDPKFFGASYYWFGEVPINENNGVISMRPSSVGTFDIYLYAGNSAGYDVKLLTLQVDKASADVTISNTAWRKGNSPNAPVIGTDSTLTIPSTTLG